MGTGDGEEAAGERTRAAAEASEVKEEGPVRMEGLAAVRALVREVIAEELERFWERRFGGRP